MESEWEKLDHLASHLKIENKILEAIQCLEMAIVLADKANPHNRAILNNKIAALYLRVGDYGNAEKAARKTLVLERQYGDKGRETTNLADYCVMLAQILEKQNRFEEALKYVSEALPIYSDLLGEANNFVIGVVDYKKFVEENTWRG